MAYVNQETKARIAPQVKQVLAKWGLKGSLSVNHHSTLVLNIRAGKLDFIANSNSNTEINHPGSRMASTYIGVNRYHLNSQFDGECLKCVQELMDVLNKFNWDRSDRQSDYFDVGYYVDIRIGQWNKPYVWQQ
jgi:hypothetical protein